MTQRERWYIAGPMRGVKDYNYPLFHAAEAFLRKQGLTPQEIINPAALDGGTPPEPGKELPLNVYMRRDLPLVAGCTDILLLPGWERSQGARIELTIALACGVRPHAAMVWDEGIVIGHEPLTVHVETPAASPRPEPQPPPADEVRLRDPQTGAEKGMKPARWDLLPWDALEQVAIHYGRGAAKYSDRNWEKGYPWSWSARALVNHYQAWIRGEDNDAEMGTHHLAAVAFHALALLAFARRGLGTDDRPKLKTATPAPQEVKA